MYNSKLYKKFENLLKKDKRIVSQNGSLLRNKIIELALKSDLDLIKLLLSDNDFKGIFFQEIEDVTIFKSDQFIKFVNNKEILPNSYTSFGNKIGLTSNDEFIEKSEVVVLNWPYKDCVLKAGMTSEDDDSRKEIFLNEILAADEIDCLYKPKVLTNFKRINSEGEESVDEIKPQDNLIIRGNNLLALHSLKQKFEGKIKLIYLDPPYNIGHSFRYNDNFNHSTWLTFMKNRLEGARDLLSEDGTIFIQINDVELAYLKVLCDEIFNRSNFIQFVEIQSNEGAAYQFQNPNMAKMCEYGLLYAKDRNKRVYKKFYTEGEWDRNYNKIILNPDEPDIMNWNIGTVMDEINNELDHEPTDEEIKNFVIRNADRIFRGIAPKGAGEGLCKAMKESKKDNWAVYEREDLDDIICYNGEMIRFYKKNIGEIEGEMKILREMGSLWTDIKWTGIAKEGGVKLKGGKKPEKLLHRIIEMGSEPGEIVMDFFLGTGTTCAVAHMMSRQFIGIEQLDYFENDAVVRLKNTMGDYNSPISRILGWEGGGDFIYCELMKLNKKYIEKIQEIEDPEVLLEILEEMTKNAILTYQFDIKKFEAKIEDFNSLNLEEKKKFLISILDKNQLYLNLSEIDDEDYEISDEFKSLNKSFYGIKED